MKFFALVALALVATSDASTVAAVTATRSTSLVAGAAGGNLVLSVTASNAGAIAASGTITAVVDGNIFSADGDTACTATAEDASGTAVTTAPTFVSTLTGTAANKGVVTNQGTGTETITFTMGAVNTDILADDHKIIITCTGNLATNAATATTYTFSVTTSGDTTAATGAYTLKTTPTFTSAARGGGTTNLMTGMAGGDLVMVIAPVTDLPAGGTITVTPSAALFSADGASACTASNSATTNPTFASATVSGTGGTQIITFTLGAGATDVIATTIATTITCTDNLAVNTAAGAITFGLVTSTDLEAATAQTGYTIVARTCPLWTSAARATTTTGVAGGDLTVIFTTTASLANSQTITLTPSADIFSADGDTSCTASTAATTNPAFVSTLTGTAANKGVVSDTSTAQKITFTLAATTTDIVAANTAVTIVCTDNLAVNGAAASAVTFSIATQTDTTTLAGQTGYTITAATSAASSTASVSMLTMLALAAVAMRQ